MLAAIGLACAGIVITLVRAQARTGLVASYNIDALLVIDGIALG
jgi:hypothetical protein